jgi:hypothetical protein
MTMVVELAETSEQLRSTLHEIDYEDNLRTGAAMDMTAIVAYAHEQIRRAQET